MSTTVSQICSNLLEGGRSVLNADSKHRTSLTVLHLIQRDILQVCKELAVDTLMHLPFDPAISLAGSSPKLFTKAHYKNFHWSIFCNREYLKAPYIYI